MIRPLLCFRPINFIFCRNWYSFYRFIHKQIHNNGDTFRIIDIGFVSVGWKTENNLEKRVWMK